jgi:hypothetical protein
VREGGRSPPKCKVPDTIGRGIRLRRAYGPESVLDTNSSDAVFSLTSIAARRFQAGPIRILVSAIDSLLQLCGGRDHLVHIRD